MSDIQILFAGSAVTIACRSPAAESFVHLLFQDIVDSPPGKSHNQPLILTPEPGTGKHLLTAGKKQLFCGSLGICCAAVLYDAVIYRLLENAGGGIALHAGAVTSDTVTILIPGQSGSGKSTLTAWLTAQGFNYLTDELVFIPEDKPARIEFFNRPVCLKTSGVQQVKRLLRDKQLTEVLEDECGAIVPHRLLNPASPAVPNPRWLMLLPNYQPGSALSFERLSAAQLSTVLMSCHVNARNLAGHGFGQVVKLARATRAYRLTYSGFRGLREALATLPDSAEID